MSYTRVTTQIGLLVEWNGVHSFILGKRATFHRVKLYKQLKRASKYIRRDESSWRD
jgi:hypothetical protein